MYKKQFVRAVQIVLWPGVQPEAAALKVWRTAGAVKASRKAATEYFAAALCTRAAKKPLLGGGGRKVNLQRLGQGDAAEEE